MTAFAALRRRPRLGIAAAVALVLVAAWWWTRPAETAATATEQSLVVQPRPFAVTLSFAGRVVPGNAVSVIAPFDGAIRSVEFAYGNRVAAGDVLLQLDTQDIAATRNEAEAAYLKARQASDDVANWPRSTEVARAERQLRAATLDLQQTEREAAESARLLDRGLIARNEHDGILQQLRARRMSAASARDELASTRARGDANDARAARLELANARARLDQAEQRLRNADVRATATGVIVRPATTSAIAGGAPIQPGTHVTRGQMIGSIARDGGLAVAFEVDEADVNALAVGQAVTIVGPGFAPLAARGRITSIAAEASDPAVNGAQTRFTATAELDPVPAEQADRIRIGMSAVVTVTTYERAAAIVVPPLAVEGGPSTGSVTVRSDGGTRRAAVRLGRVTPEGIEVLSGLRPGETVIWSPPDPSPPTDPS